MNTEEKPKPTSPIRLVAAFAIPRSKGQWVLLRTTFDESGLPVNPGVRVGDTLETPRGTFIITDINSGKFIGEDGEGSFPILALTVNITSPDDIIFKGEIAAIHAHN